MKKVSTKKKKETLAARAENIKQKLFLGDETMEFLDYVDKEYQVKLSKRALSSFQKNKERDLAILALLLASGVRLSEAVNLDLRDVNLKMMIIEVTRKGGKRDSVNVAGFAKPYLEAYMNIRQQRYKAEKRIQPSSCPNTVVYPIVSTLLPLRKWWLSTLRTSRYA